MGSDHGCDCKGSRDDVPSGGGEGARWGQGCDCKRSRDDVQPGGGDGWGHITDATTKGAEMTYNLEAERERDGVRSWMRLQGEQGRRTIWRRRRITMGSGMRLQKEQGRRTTWWWRGMGSYHRCDYKGSRDDVQSGGGEGTRRGQITDATAKGAGTTYPLEAEKDHDGVRDATAKGAGTTYNLVV